MGSPFYKGGWSLPPFPPHHCPHHHPYPLTDERIICLSARPKCSHGPFGIFGRGGGGTHPPLKVTNTKKRFCPEIGNLAESIVQCNQLFLKIKVQKSQNDYFFNRVVIILFVTFHNFHFSLGLFSICKTFFACEIYTKNWILKNI